MAETIKVLVSEEEVNERIKTLDDQESIFREPVRRGFSRLWIRIISLWNSTSSLFSCPHG